MSRSNREPYATDGYGGKWRRLAKRRANRKVRNSSDVPDGRAYRKISNSWDICDYRFYMAGAIADELPWHWRRK